LVVEEVSMAIKIETGSLEQLLTLMEINYQVFKGMYASEPYSLEQYKQKLEGKKPTIFVARDTNTGMICGDSISFPAEDGSYYLWIMGVHPAYMGRGIGAELLSRNEVAAASQGFSSITTKVYAVSDSMHHLLKKNGYVATATDHTAKDPRMYFTRYRLELKGQAA
jgi:ribosomal protein S18 acetylase RimI-like enzyme